MRITKPKLLLAALLAATVAVTGCGKTEGDDPANPSAGALTPTGTVQGVLADSVTQQPIVGAVIDIDGITATTNENGQYSLHNVPASCDEVAGSNNECESVTATINLRNVTSPVKRTNKADGTVVCTDPVTKDATGALITAACYPDFAYNDVEIFYTSLNDTTNDAGDGDSATNHDTPVTGLMMSMDIYVGKLAATINGVVAGASDLQAVGAGYTVQLVSKCSSTSGGTTGGTAANGTGGCNNIVGSTTTDANGEFTFANVESLQNFDITAVSPDGMTRGSEDVTAPSDGQTKTLVIQRDDTTYDLRAVLVGSIDNIAPIVISVSPENGADLSPTGGVDVVFTFSEPIKQDVYATTLTNNALVGTATGLWADVRVNYTGAKTGNIAHTLTWTDSKTLTVNIPTLAPASRYEVALCQDNNADGDCADGGENAASLVDATGNAVTNLETVGEGIVTFTTNGAAAAAAPTVTLVNSASIDSTGDDPILDWASVSGAKAYNIYRAKNQVWGTTTNAGVYAYVDTADTSDFTDTTIPDDDGDGLEFVENLQTKLTYSYVVKSVNADGTESAASTAVTAADSVKPGILGVAGTGAIALPADGLSATYYITVQFGESMDETTVEAAVANYVIGKNAGAPATDVVPVVTAIGDAIGNQYDPATGTVPLKVTITNPAGGAETYSGAWTLQLTAASIKDVAGNIMDTTADAYNNATGLTE